MQALVLGTAQWGTPYGLTNERGRLEDADLVEIMAAAGAAGLDRVDTASGYGDAEARLALWADGLEITTKVKAASPAPMREQLQGSLNRLGISTVRTLLIHDWFRLNPAQAESAAQELAELRAAGLVREIGISGYEPADVETALEHFDHLDAVQMPVNALDSRLDGHMVRVALMKEGTRIQARSVFLQGLLARSASIAMGRHPDVLAFHEACRQLGVTSLEGALAALRSKDWISEVVVGVTSGSELAEIAAAWTSPLREPLPFAPSGDLSLIDPRNWA